MCKKYDIVSPLNQFIYILQNWWKFHLCGHCTPSLFPNDQSSHFQANWGTRLDKLLSSPSWFSWWSLEPDLSLMWFMKIIVIPGALAWCSISIGRQSSMCLRRAWPPFPCLNVTMGIQVWGKGWGTFGFHVFVSQSKELYQGHMPK